MLSSRISVPTESHSDVEDIFSSSLSILFTDDAQALHGTPGQPVIYHSPRFGEIRLAIPQHPDREEGRILFAHYLWNSGIIVADAIEQASQNGGGHELWKKQYWDLRGRDVLELGAGTALPSIIAARSTARSITVTDHSLSPALTTHAIHANLHQNLGVQLVPLEPLAATHANPSSDQTQWNTPIIVAGYVWGTSTFSSITSTSPDQPTLRTFNTIIAADCIWMPSQHLALLTTIATYLSPNPDSYALVVGGFHTGRTTVARFFDLITGHLHGSDSDESEADLEQIRGKLRLLERFEVDMDLNRRAWCACRKDETKHDLKRWCVVAILGRT